MHFYEYHQRSGTIAMQAKEKYGWLFDDSLSDESIESRYWLLEYLHSQYGYTGDLKKDTRGMPCPIFCNEAKIFWSLSHSEKYVAFIVSDTPVGIDISENIERDRALFSYHTDSEYQILWGKNWENFYILWTGKEAVIKICGWILDDMMNICLLSISSENSGIFAFWSKKYKVSHEKHPDFILSYAVSSLNF